ncbi:TFIIB-type zinc ribbon-containing protein [Kribbella sp. CA-293567]|uniref:TFIIB-type zinc ribbon-containing protein n=1 Tax=Kribbella sp. CA-293567 TaxID=3002436 RepID=UPI0022DE0629|nr:zf-TFIIB domain-containing protein [Kribbella sp. CA-293567]WBQ05692.1 zf-TFIIB domain-containing protein [Kribbella sp. CA-293567]
METLTCPKCRGSMRTYERSGVTVDQCTECRGIFLDRGELEKLVDAEIAYNGPQPVQQPPAPAPQQPRYEEKRYDDRRYEDKRRYDNDRDRYQQYPQRKKKKSFFDELFD